METREDLDKSIVPATILGHVGDGNFHVIFSLDPDSSEEAKEVSRLNDRIVQRALAMDGTCTGEHGIGLGKQAALIDELGNAVDLMRTIKHALDPQGLLNPGKIFADSRRSYLRFLKAVDITFLIASPCSKGDDPC